MAGIFADKQIAGFIAKPCDPPDLLMEVGRILFMTASSEATTFPAPRSSAAGGGRGRPAAQGAADGVPLRAGFEIEAVATGAEALGVRLAQAGRMGVELELEGMSADEVVGTLKRLPHSRGITRGRVRAGPAGRK